MRCLLVILCSLWSQAVLAQGFAVHDLTKLSEDARSALGGDTAVQAQPLQLILTCPNCEGAPKAALQLGRLTDGTESRIRSGKTTMGALETMCIQKNPDCRLTTLPAGPAVAWITSYAFGTGAGATAIVLRDGDLLTIDARSTDRGAAEDAVLRLAQKLLPRIVGR
ncbi:hypothetical protein SAMN05216360_104238 [Methylobacterium phyllostachyos]|uniref:Uncharacterized protein n=1 Tax=Methylobacterium phyllostachyos TaxID=582672 RepID=A0A1G9X4H1_9HYPH|nr:hypothetical protein [Methylobacterium phyllostachyos]SDM91376.1 hypothetical protein SAMN05216360_104238 [Methylobacterium phyllostachyos]